MEEVKEEQINGLNNQTQKINELKSINLDLNMENDQLQMKVDQYKSQFEELAMEVKHKENEMNNNMTIMKFEDKKHDEEMENDELHSINSFWIDDFDTELTNYNITSNGSQKVHNFSKILSKNYLHFFRKVAIKVNCLNWNTLFMMKWNFSEN